MMKQIKNFFYPNRGVLGVYALWVIVAMSILLLNPTFRFVFENPIVLLTDFAFNLVVLYLLSCLSIWIYEKMKKK